MLRGLVQLTWLEIKIFAREPMGVLGTVLVPAAVFLVLGRALGHQAGGDARAAEFLRVKVPVLAALLVVISAMASLVTIIAIYREGGILRRLRVTPLRPHTILTAHVVVKLLFTAATMALLAAVGKRYYPVSVPVPLLGVAAAVVVSVVSLLSVGFVLASLVPTARFAQPITAAILYPLIAVSGLFTPIDRLPPGLHAIARLSPLTYAVSLMQGALLGEPWRGHAIDLAALALTFVVCTAISARFFRWE